MTLDGKTALVTGGSRGIGRAIVRRLAGLGATVVFTYRENGAAAEEVAAETGATAVRADQADLAITFSYPGDRDDPHGASAHGLSVKAIGSDDLLMVLPAGHAAAACPAGSTSCIGSSPYARTSSPRALAWCGSSRSPG